MSPTKIAKRALLGVALLSTFMAVGARLTSQEPAEEREERIRDLEEALERARLGGNEAEVDEIVELLRRLRREERPEPLPPPPFVIDCGPPGDEAESRRERIGDLRVVADRGHLRGEGFSRWFHMIWGRPERDLFARGRVGLRSCRLPLPPGEYLVGLGFCEAEHHIPNRRVFDVSLQGEERIVGLDPLVVGGGRDRAFRLMQRVTVEDGEGLQIAFRSRRGESLLNALWVYPAGERGAPEPPGGLRLTGSYGAVVVDWNAPVDPAVRGVLVERSTDGEAFRALFDDPVPVSRWIDREVEVDRLCRYRLVSVDVDGRRSAPGPELAARSRDRDRSTLPVYELEIPEESQTYLLGRVHEERTVRVVFSHRGREFAAELRLRGAVTRLAEKKSYRLRFPGEVPEGLRRVTCLKAEPHDFTLQREKLTCDLFASLGLPVSDARFVNLFINGEYQGVYLDIEPIRAPFKRRAGLDPEGTLLRARSFQHLDEGRPGDLRGQHGSVDELGAFLRRVNRVERGDLTAFVKGETEWPRLRDYLVASVLCHRSEIEADDSFYYRDPASGRWSIIPWDHNNGNFGLRGTEPRIPEPFMDVRGQTLQAIGYGPRYWYVLPSRILHDAALREEYLKRLEELARDLLLSGRVDGWIRANFDALREEAVVDPQRWPRQEKEPFLDSERQLRRFVKQHGLAILEQVARERRREREPLVINEFHFGERKGWIEIHNRGDAEISLDGHGVGDVEARFARAPLRGTLEPGAYRVFTFEHRPLPPRERPEAAGDDGEARERREIEERRRWREHFPGFSPLGGTVGLFAPAERERVPRGDRDDERDDDRHQDPDDRPRLIDWYFYGPRNAELSYGRHGEGFGPLTPTPGRANVPGGS